MIPDPDFAKAQLDLRLAILELNMAQLAHLVQELLMAREDLGALRDQRVKLKRIETSFRWSVRAFRQAPGIRFPKED